MSAEPTAPEPRWRILARSDFTELETRAGDLLKAYRGGGADAVSLFSDFHPSPPEPTGVELADARLALARSHDFPNWSRFRCGVELFNAIAADDADAVLGLIRAQPDLLHERVNGVTSNWGPPLPCAVQVGSRRVFDALLEIPGQDLQWALGRAILKGRIDMARALMAAGAEPEPGEAMGPCETLSLEGLRFLAGIDAPLTDEHGDAMAPVGMLLEGYHRDPDAKHACLAFFAEQGLRFPDTAVMAFHLGRIDLLEAHLAREPDLPHRRFSHREIYPLELGCQEDQSLGLHGTPLDGTTLLHMAIDFDELEIARWLVAKGADVNAAADVDAEGFGGHTALFNAVVSQAYQSGRQRDGAVARLLLDQGADPNARASIRKGIRFIADETVHAYRDVTPLAYGRAFHARAWV
ncbi:MAG: ankyrin repeat domain-containing protein, partial [Methyloligellaceae bacterium]